MAAVQLRPSMLHRLRQLWGAAAAPIAAPAPQNASLVATPAATTLLQRLGLADLIPALLLAVPKQRTSYGKKRMRMTHKHLRTSQTAIRCRMCGAWTRPHFYCKPNCIGRRHRDDEPGGDDVAMAG